MPLLVSSNWAAWILGIIVFVVYEGGTLAAVGWREMRRRWIQNVGLGVLATIAGYLVLFCWSFVQTVYDEHHDSTGRWQEVVNEKNALKQDIKDRDNYIKRLESRTCPSCNARAVVRPPQQSEIISEVVANSRIVCTLKDSTKMPGDAAINIPSADSYIEGMAGKSYLTSRSFYFKRTEEEGKVVAIEDFRTPPNSDLIGRPLSALSNYSRLVIVATSTSGGWFSVCNSYEFALRVNGREIWRAARIINIPMDEKNGVMIGVHLQGLNLSAQP